MRTQSPLPAPALWAEPHRWGWAKRRVLRLGPCGSTSSAAQPAPGQPGASLVQWAAGEDAAIGRETAPARGSGANQTSALCSDYAAETAAAGGCRLPGALGSPAAAASEPRFREPSQPASSPPLRRREQLRRAGTGARGGAGWERSGERGGCTNKPEWLEGVQRYQPFGAEHGFDSSTT